MAELKLITTKMIEDALTSENPKAVLARYLAKTEAELAQLKNDMRFAITHQMWPDLRHMVTGDVEVIHHNLRQIERAKECLKNNHEQIKYVRASKLAKEEVSE